MSYEPDKPTEGEPSMPGVTVKNDGHNIKWVSTVPDISLKIFDIKDVNNQTIAVMQWAAFSSDGVKVYQPCIQAKIPLRVLYDGESINSFGHESLVNPFPGKELCYEADETYFFRNATVFNSPSTIDMKYNLTKNNASLRFNNISLFHRGSNVGVAMDFRASYQNDKCVVVLASMLKFETPEAP